MGLWLNTSLIKDGTHQNNSLEKIPRGKELFVIVCIYRCVQADHDAVMMGPSETP